MARMTELQADWSGGMDQDAPMHQLPSNKAFLIENMLPSLEWQGAIQMRQGWTDYSGNLSTIRPATASIAALGSSEGGSIYAVDDDGELWSFSPTTHRGTAVVTHDKPKSFAGHFIITDRNGNTSPRYFQSGTIGTLTGAPPAVFQEIHKGRFVLANSSVNLNRIWFSDGYDPTTWDLTGGWMDTSRFIQGLASVNNMLIVFSWDMIERIRGGVPPPGPGDDMILEPVSGTIGCIDSRSIVVYGNRAIFASMNGLYETDGVSVRNLSDEAGMRSHYIENFSPIMTGVVWKNYYLLSIPAKNIFYVVDLVTNYWFVFTNVKSAAFVVPTGTFGQIFFGSSDTPYVRNCTNMFNQLEDSFQSSQDADGTRISPRIQTSYYGVDRLGPKRWKMLQPMYELRAGFGSPSMRVSVSTSTSFSQRDSVLSKVLPATSVGEIRRERVAIGLSSQGLALDFQLTPGTDRVNAFRLYRLDANVHARESSRGVFA